MNNVMGLQCDGSVWISSHNKCIRTGPCRHGLLAGKYLLAFLCIPPSRVADPHCDSSRRIIQHWKSCDRRDCCICMPVKAVIKPAGSGESASSAMPTGELYICTWYHIVLLYYIANIAREYTAKSTGAHTCNCMNSMKMYSIQAVLQCIHLMFHGEVVCWNNHIAPTSDNLQSMKV